MADQTLCNLQSGVTALMLAAENGHTKVVKMLLQHEASVDFQNEVSISS